MTRPGTIIRWHALRRLLRSECGNRSLILDIGGYDGFIACNLERACRDLFVAVVDMDMSGLIIARGRGAHALCASALALPFADSTCDVVLCLDLIEHVKDDEVLIGEIHRILKNGGTVVLTTPEETGISFPFIGGEEMARVQKGWGHLRLGYRIDDIRRFFKAHSLIVEREGKYFNMVSRLAYRTLMLYGTPSRASWWIFRGIAALECVTTWGAQEHIVVGRKCDG